MATVHTPDIVVVAAYLHLQWRSKQFFCLFLGLVHSFVSSADKGLTVLALFPLGDPHTEAQPSGCLLLECFFDLLTEGCGLFLVGIREYDREFITPITKSFTLVVLCRQLNNDTDDSEKSVPLEMTIFVIKLLKSIHIEHDKREISVPLSSPVDLFVET